MSGWGERPSPRPPQRPGEAGGGTDVGGAASGGKRPSTIEQRSAASGPRAVARQKGVGKPIPVVEAPILVTGPETGGFGPSGRSVLVLAEDRLVRSPIAGGEAACRVAVARGDAPGVQLGADPADRRMSERGKRPGGARRAREGMGQAHRPPLPPGRGGGPVVVVAVTPHRGGRESRPQGEGVQVGPAARSDGRRSPVNIGASLPDRSEYSKSGASRPGEQSRVVLMESRMRWKSHVRFGGRRRGNHRPKGRHRRLAADPARHGSRSRATWHLPFASFASVSRA
jgi:hypothetical protein